MNGIGHIWRCAQVVTRHPDHPSFARHPLTKLVAYIFCIAVGVLSIGLIPWALKNRVRRIIEVYGDDLRIKRIVHRLFKWSPPKKLQGLNERQQYELRVGLKKALAFLEISTERSLFRTSLFTDLLHVVQDPSLTDEASFHALSALTKQEWRLLVQTLAMHAPLTLSSVIPHLLEIHPGWMIELACADLDRGLQGKESPLIYPVITALEHRQDFDRIYSILEKRWHRFANPKACDRLSFSRDTASLLLQHFASALHCMTYPPPSAMSMAMHALNAAELLSMSQADDPHFLFWKMNSLRKLPTADWSTAAKERTAQTVLQQVDVFLKNEAVDSKWIQILQNERLKLAVAHHQVEWLVSHSRYEDLRDLAPIQEDTFEETEAFQTWKQFLEIARASETLPLSDRLAVERALYWVEEDESQHPALLHLTEDQYTLYCALADPAVIANTDDLEQIGGALFETVNAKSEHPEETVDWEKGMLATALYWLAVQQNDEIKKAEYLVLSKHYFDQIDSAALVYHPYQGAIAVQVAEDLLEIPDFSHMRIPYLIQLSKLLDIPLIKEPLKSAITDCVSRHLDWALNSAMEDNAGREVILDLLFSLFPCFTATQLNESLEWLFADINPIHLLEVCKRCHEKWDGLSPQPKLVSVWQHCAFHCQQQAEYEDHIGTDVQKDLMEEAERCYKQAILLSTQLKREATWEQTELAWVKYAQAMSNFYSETHRNECLEESLAIAQSLSYNHLPIPRWLPLDSVAGRYENVREILAMHLYRIRGNEWKAREAIEYMTPDMSEKNTCLVMGSLNEEEREYMHLTMQLNLKRHRDAPQWLDEHLQLIQFHIGLKNETDPTTISWQSLSAFVLYLRALHEPNEGAFLERSRIAYEALPALERQVKNGFNLQGRISIVLNLLQCLGEDNQSRQRQKLVEELIHLASIPGYNYPRNQSFLKWIEQELCLMWTETHPEWIPSFSSLTPHTQEENSLPSTN